ncbi:MAG TPA: ferritin-like domain-containing protein [Stellaceae bacterium]|nr:ferritin-like domain-containing protein [Stellaceae bacterium]
MITGILRLSDVSASRRKFMRGAGTATLSGLAIAMLAGCESQAAANKPMMAAANTSDDVAILNTALGLEYQAIAAYQVGAESGLLQKPVLDLAVQFQSDHKKHAEILNSTITKMGGAAVMAKKPMEYGFPTASLKSQADVLKFAANLEQGAASAYLGAVPAFMSKDLSKYAASILGDEAMHWAVLRNALGENPVPAAFIS